MLYLLLYPLHTEFTALNVFRYLSFRLIYAAITAFLIAFVLAPPLIRRLQAIKLGQHIREDGPSRHLSKEGTPTMGGVLILFAVMLATTLWADISNQYVWLALGATFGYGLIGFADDCRKFMGGKSRGRTAGQKILSQSLLALTIGLAFYYLPGYSTKLSVPFFKNFTPDLGLLYIPFAVLVIVGASNAVNLTDGLDGLAVGPVMIAAMAYTVVAYVVGNKIMSDYLLIPYIEGAGELAVFTAAIFGASLGFLWFNTYPDGVHGRRGIAAAGGRPRHGCGGQQARAVAAARRRRVRHRGDLGHLPGGLLQIARQEDLPHGADPPPFRDERLGGTEGRRAALDYRDSPGVAEPQHAEAQVMAAHGQP